MGSKLPLDVIIDILVWLPVKSLLRFKSVSREWFNLINHPPFIQLHLQKSNDLCNAKPSIACFHENSYGRSLFCLGVLDSLRWVPTDINELPPIIVNNSWHVGSCNGLLCFYYDCFLVICNPSTGTFREIVFHWEFSKTFIFSRGFGYDCENDDYKIVLMEWPCGNPMSVYSLKHNQWTKHSALPYFTASSGPVPIHIWNPVFANKRLHWVSKTREKFQIARFNLCSEQWEELILSPITPIECIHKLTVLDGCLCFCSNEHSTMDIWIMKEYGVQESWTKLASVRRDSTSLVSIPTPITYSRSKSRLLFLSYDADSLFWYDINQQSYTEVEQSSVPMKKKMNYLFLPYDRSLVRIPS